MDDFHRKARSASEAWKSRLGVAVKAARERRGLSQEALADLIGASTSTVSEIERGLTVPSIGTAWAIADRLAVTLDDLVGREPPPGAFQPGLIMQPADGDETEAPDTARDRQRLVQIERELREMRGLVAVLLESEGQPKAKRRGARSA